MKTISGEVNAKDLIQMDKACVNVTDRGVSETLPEICTPKQLLSKFVGSYEQREKCPEDIDQPNRMMHEFDH